MNKESIDINTEGLTREFPLSWEPVIRPTVRIDHRFSANHQAHLISG